MDARNAVGWLSGGFAVYVAAQGAVGAEIGMAAAALVLYGGWDLSAALAATLPLGLPLVALHLAVVSAVLLRTHGSHPAPPPDVECDCNQENP